MTQNNQGYRRYVDEDLQPERLKKNSPLGQSEPHLNGWVYPQVVLTPLSVGVRLEPATAQLGTIVAYLTRVGRYLVGQYFTPNGREVGDGTISFKNLDKQIPSLPSKLDFYEVYYQVTNEAYAEIKRAEDEHLDDMEYAFTLSLKRVAETITSLSGVYKSKEEAINKLVTTLAGNAAVLVPPNPADLQSWQPHLMTVARILIEQSSRRDKERDHSAAGYTATIAGQTITLVPTFNNPHRPAAGIIHLEDISPEDISAVSGPTTVPTSSPQPVMQQPATLAPGMQAVLKSPIKNATVYKDESAARAGSTQSRDFFAESLRVGTAVTVIALLSPGAQAEQAKVLVAFDQHAGSGVDSDLFDVYDRSKFYIVVAGDQLALK